MNTRVLLHIGYWILILLFLTLFFGFKWDNYNLAFYFSTMLLPIVMGTSYFFNRVLVSRYLLTGRYGEFTLYFFYMLVVSLYMEMLVALLSFVVLANYRVDVMDLESISIFMLGINLYLVVFATSFIQIVLRLRQKAQEVSALAAEIEKRETAYILIRANRQNHQVPLDELLYIESLSDYVKVVTTATELTAREKISKLQQRLPGQFIRIHRSFVVNRDMVQSFSKNEVSLGNGVTLPVGRTYKQQVVEALERSID